MMNTQTSTKRTEVEELLYTVRNLTSIMYDEFYEKYGRNPHGKAYEPTYTFNLDLAHNRLVFHLFDYAADEQGGVCFHITERGLVYTIKKHVKLEYRYNKTFPSGDTEDLEEMLERLVRLRNLKALLV